MDLTGGMKEEAASRLSRDCGVNPSTAVSVLLGSAGNMGCVVGVVLMNKYMQLTHEFEHLIFLTFCHFAFTAVGMRVMLLCGMFEYKAAKSDDVMPVALGSLSSVGFMNLSLKYNSVGFYQISKIACIPLTLLFSYVLEGSAPSAPIMATLVPLGVGLGIAQAHDYEANTLGTAYAAISVVCTVLYQITTSSCQSKLSIDSNQLLYHTAPLITVGMLLMCPLFDDFAALRTVDWNSDLVVHILISCALALGANLTNYYVLGLTSPLSYQVLTHLKSILTIIGSILFFGTRVNPLNILGIFIALFGVFSYTEVKRRAAVRSLERERRRRRDLPMSPTASP